MKFLGILVLSLLVLLVVNETFSLKKLNAKNITFNILTGNVCGWIPFDYKNENINIFDPDILRKFTLGGHIQCNNIYEITIKK